MEKSMCASNEVLGHREKHGEPEAWGQLATRHRGALWLVGTPAAQARRRAARVRLPHVDDAEDRQLHAGQPRVAIVAIAPVDTEGVAPRAASSSAKGKNATTRTPPPARRAPAVPEVRALVAEGEPQLQDEPLEVPGPAKAAGAFCDSAACGRVLRGLRSRKAVLKRLDHPWLPPHA